LVAKLFICNEMHNTHFIWLWQWKPLKPKNVWTTELFGIGN